MIANASLPHVCYTTLKHLDPIVENQQDNLHEKQMNFFCVSELFFSNVSIFQVLTPKQNLPVYYN